MNKLAIIESHQASEAFGPLIDSCNDVLALIGHANLYESVSMGDRFI